MGRQTSKAKLRMSSRNEALVFGAVTQSLRQERVSNQHRYVRGARALPGIAAPGVRERIKRKNCCVWLAWQHVPGVNIDEVRRCVTLSRHGQMVFARMIPW